MLEQFVFDFSYTPTGAASMEVSASHGANRTATIADANATNVAGLRKQACALVRALSRQG